MTSDARLAVKPNPDVQDDVAPEHAHSTRNDIHMLEEEIAAVEQEVHNLRFRRRWTLSIGIPIVLFLLAVIAIQIDNVVTSEFLSESFRTLLLPSDIGPGLGTVARILFAWITVLFLLVGTYAALVELPLRSAEVQLVRLEEKMRLRRLSNSEERKAYLRSELARLTIETPQSLFEHRTSYEEVERYRDAAGKLLDDADADLTEVQSLIDSIQVIALREEQEQADLRNWRYLALGIMCAYLAAVLVMAIYSLRVGPKTIQPFGIPLFVFFWSALGSLAATFYRFYNIEGQVRFETEFRWLVARPAIGIIMGALAYLTYTTGIALAMDSDNYNLDTSVTSIVVFLAAFSDRFYLGMVDALLDKSLGKSKSDRGKIDDPDEVQSETDMEARDQ